MGGRLGGSEQLYRSGCIYRCSTGGDGGGSRRAELHELCGWREMQLLFRNQKIAFIDSIRDWMRSTLFPNGPNCNKLIPTNFSEAENRYIHRIQIHTERRTIVKNRNGVCEEKTEEEKNRVNGPLTVLSSPLLGPTPFRFLLFLSSLSVSLCPLPRLW